MDEFFLGSIFVNLRRFFAAIVGGFLLLAIDSSVAYSAAIHSVLNFKDVSALVGLGGLAESKTYSATAADYNRDGYPDFLISHHDRLSLWTNHQGRRFVDSTHLLDFNKGDMHGVSFIDINNDGYVDVTVSCGADRGRGEKENLFFINQKGVRFVRLSPAPPIIADLYGRGRSITPTDFNGDGLIDLLIFNYFQEGRPNRIAVAKGKRGGAVDFMDIGLGSGVDTVSAFGMLPIDINNNEEKYYISSGPGDDSGEIYLKQRDAFRKVSSGLGVAERGSVACAPFDYDNDGDLDLLFLHRGGSKPYGAEIVGGEIHLHYSGAHARNSFKSPFHAGEIIVDLLFENQKRPELLFLGKDKIPAAKLPLKVIIDDAKLQGAPMITESDGGVFLWQDGEGAFNFVFRGSDAMQAVFGSIIAVGASFESLTESPGKLSQNLHANTFYKNERGKFVDVTSLAGLKGSGMGRDVIAADLNNDGLMDVYQVNAGDSFEEPNPPNQLFLNKGNGTFEEIGSEANASGPTRGSGNGAIAFDYDNDGDLDLLLYNGFVKPPIKPGPVVLLQNESPEHKNSIAIDFVGRASNSRGWGAKVISKVDGRILYQQKYGLNGYLATSDLPIHIGMGKAKHADEIMITWPSGKTQMLQGVNGGKKVIQEPL